MTTFHLEFDTDGAAFEESPTGEMGRLLVEVARRLANGDLAGGIRDANGNQVGSFYFEED